MSGRRQPWASCPRGGPGGPRKRLERRPLGAAASRRSLGRPLRRRLRHLSVAAFVAPALGPPSTFVSARAPATGGGSTPERADARRAHGLLAPHIPVRRAALGRRSAD